MKTKMSIPQRILAYREENREALNGFRPTVAFGESDTLRAELSGGVPVRFVIEQNGDYRDENADLVSFRDVASFEIDIREDKEELKQRNSEGEMVSYNPPRFEYSYDFYAEIRVNNPYFDDMRFRINGASLNLETVENNRRKNFAMLNQGFDPSLYPEYRKYRAECDELEELPDEY